LISAEGSLLQSVAILYHPHRKQARVEAEWLAQEMRSRCVETAIGSGWDSETVHRLCCDRQIAVVFGGDGTIIRIARMAAPYGIPLLGINLGRVGFLAEMTPERLHDMVEPLVQERFWVESRTMLQVHCRIGDEQEEFLCLNEVAVARGQAPRAIHVNTTLDGEDFLTYTADGVLVATATGSTAYSLAAGGPIMYPESADILITPVAPHLHIGRSTIVPGDSVVGLSVSSDRAAVLSVDGGDEHPLKPRDVVEVCRSHLQARFARLGPRKYFYAAVADRLK
jgi:NAD+ kinase